MSPPSTPSRLGDPFDYPVDEEQAVRGLETGFRSLSVSPPTDPETAYKRLARAASNLERSFWDDPLTNQQQSSVSVFRNLALQMAQSFDQALRAANDRVERYQALLERDRGGARRHPLSALRPSVERNALPGLAAERRRLATRVRRLEHEIEQMRTLNRFDADAVKAEMRTALRIRLDTLTRTATITPAVAQCVLGDTL